MSGIRLWSTCPDCHKDYPLETGHRTDECRARCKHGRLPIDPCSFCENDRQFRDLIERGSLGTPEAKAIRASVTREQVDKVMARVRELQDAEDECVYCLPHLTSQHDCSGCLVEGCSCGHEPDWHPDPPRGDE